MNTLGSTIAYLLQGGLVTFSVWIVTIVCSLPLAALVAYVRKMNNRAVNTILGIYTTVIRGTPLLFQLIFVYFGLPIILKVQISPFVAASIAFVNSWTIYMSEIIRGSIDGIDKGQYEAGRVLGMNYSQIMLNIVFPQALVTAIPSLCNQAIEAIWGTSLLSTIGMDDVLKSARVILMRDFSVQPFIIAGGIYLLFNGAVVLLFKKIEERTSRFKVQYAK